jgi:hypothetical protein
VSGSIEAVIERSRCKGGFSEREKGYFRLAHEKAKLKVSEYALPDSSYYCLEFVQSAVALGAKYIDVRTSSGYFVLSFVGGHYLRSDLEGLFDYLMITRHEDDFRARRRLAIGVSAALSIPDSWITIETGDGTLEGSTRLEMEDIAQDAVIGTPSKPINGTFIRVKRPSRTRASTMSLESAGYVGGADQLELEEMVITERCLDLTVPVILNGDVVGSYASNRRIRLYGFTHSTTFDEGDLYGGLAYTPRNRDEHCQIKTLTNGVWIANLCLEALPRGFFGVIGYERLHKTASQYEIVDDERIEELEARLRPHVDRLLYESGADERKRLSAMFPLEPPDLRGTGTALTVALENPDGSTWAHLSLRPDPERDRGLELDAVWERHGRHLDHVVLDFEYPFAGRLAIPDISFEWLCRRTAGDPHYDPMHVCGLKPEIYGALLGSMLGSMDEIRSRFGDVLPEPVKVEPVQTPPPPAPQPAHPQPPEPAPEPAPEPSPEPVVLAEDDAAQEMSFPEIVVAAPAPDVIRSRLLETAEDERLDALRRCLADLLCAAPLGTETPKTIEHWCARIAFERSRSDMPVHMERMPSTVLYSWPPPVPRTRVNLDHPRVARWIEEADERPETVYALALVLFEGFNRLNEGLLAQQEMDLQDRLLALIEP